jgi:hypothetical protein
LGRLSGEREEMVESRVKDGRFKVGGTGVVACRMGVGHINRIFTLDLGYGDFRPTLAGLAFIELHHEANPQQLWDSP